MDRKKIIKKKEKEVKHLEEKIYDMNDTISNKMKQNIKEKEDGVSNRIAKVTHVYIYF